MSDMSHAALTTIMISPTYLPEEGAGLGTYVFELARGLGRAGCETTVVSY